MNGNFDKCVLCTQDFSNEFVCFLLLGVRVVVVVMMVIAVFP